jgi:tRNA (cmo5U34)-methyltransferase
MHSTRDNKTSQPALQYDENISKTIPCYQLFNNEIINLVKCTIPRPKSWLDTGCGTGTLILQAIQEFGKLKFVAADPSAEMLRIAREKMSGTSDLEIRYILAGTEQFCCDESFDVVTAILAHHYLSTEDRIKAAENCFRMLNKGGMYVTFETIRPNTEQGMEIGLKRWRSAQIANGKAPKSVDHHLERYGTELLPITIESHLDLLRKIGYRAVEILWASGMQAGFYGIK